jgi:hypothetical protein
MSRHVVVRPEVVDGKEVDFIFNKKGESLAVICWDADWKCWTFCPEPDMRFSADCQQEILDRTKERDVQK